MEDAGNTAGGQGPGMMAFARYRDLEVAADRTAAKIKEGFMEMGYILKVARDTDILAGSGYGSHEEFAEKRYGLDKGTVSRYIRIVERFSVGGNSHVLGEGYRGIGFAKLSLMLHMPDAVAEEIGAGYSKQEVQEIKEEIDAERAVSDIEVAVADAETPPEEKSGTLLERAVRQLGREQPQIYGRLHDIYLMGGSAAMVMEVLAPQGEAIHMVRIPGTGRLMVSLSGDSAGVTAVRSGEKERYGSRDVLGAAMAVCHKGTAADAYLLEYGEPMEPVREESRAQGGKEEVAPVQPKEKRRESKVTKAALRKAPEAAAVRKPEEPELVEAENLPGQAELVDYPGVVPSDPCGEGTPPAAGGSPEPVCAEVVSGTVGSGTDIWMDAERRLDRLNGYFAVLDRKHIPGEMLRQMYQEAIGLAAAMERLMDAVWVGHV